MGRWDLRWGCIAAAALWGCTAPEPPASKPPPDRSGRPEDTAGPERPVDTAPPYGGDPSVDRVPDWAPVFGTRHGRFTAPFSLELSNPLGEGELRYTLDASRPEGPAGQVYEGPLDIDTTTVVRAAVVDPESGSVLWDAGAQTYLFLDHVKDQTAPADWPTSWWADWEGGPYPADTTLDPEVLSTPEEQAALVASLEALPIVALTIAPGDLFGETGIHENPKESGRDWERLGWVEWFEPGDGGDVTQEVSYRIHGGAGRRPDRSPKKSFRLLGRRAVAGDFTFPVYPEAPVTEFDTLVLRAGYNRTWAHYEAQQRRRALYARESFATGLYRDMGQLSVRVRHAHLFLDGLYWGVYQVQERPDASFHASWLGGEDEDYDALNSGVLTDGEDAGWLELFDRAREDLSIDARYEAVAALLEIDAFIDYMVLNHYLGNLDWPEKNYWAARNRAEDGPFYFRVWDAELIQSVSTHDVIDETAVGGPGELFQALRAHPEFRLRVADRVQAHFFHGGALTDAAVLDRWATATGGAQPGMDAESARWGDHWRDARADGGELYRTDPHWLAEDAYVRDFWIPRRTAIYLGQLASRGLWPAVAAVAVDPPGGAVSSGAAVTLTVPAGEAWCTTDGTDPRAWGGAVAAGATPCPASLVVSSDLDLSARVRSGDAWSPIVSLRFTVAR